MFDEDILRTYFDKLSNSKGHLASKRLNVQNLQEFHLIQERKVNLIVL